MTKLWCFRLRDRLVEQVVLFWRNQSSPTNWFTLNLEVYYRLLLWSSNFTGFTLMFSTKIWFKYIWKLQIFFFFKYFKWQVFWSAFHSHISKTSLNPYILRFLPLLVTLCPALSEQKILSILYNISENKNFKYETLRSSHSAAYVKYLLLKHIGVRESITW